MITRFIVTAFGLGYFPIAPGTWASLAAVLAAWGIVDIIGPWGLVSATAASLALGLWASRKYAERTGNEDPSEVVIDEVGGMWLSLLLVPKLWWAYGLAFAAFRVFDIFKPWPASYFDRKVGGGLGIMGDDVVAALYALVVVHVALYFWGPV